VLEKIFETCNATDLSTIPMLTRAEKKSLRMALRNRLPHYDADFQDIVPSLRYYDPQDEPLDLLDDPYEIEIPTLFMGNMQLTTGVTLPLKIPLLSYSAEIGSFSVQSLVNLFQSIQILPAVSSPLKWYKGGCYSYHPHIDYGPNTTPLSLLLYALLSEKRVVFLGYGRPSGQVAECVLACVALASAGDLIPGTVTRCFPYASLANIEALLQMYTMITQTWIHCWSHQSSV
jgi:Stabilization of polarity axis